MNSSQRFKRILFGIILPLLFGVIGFLILLIAIRPLEDAMYAKLLYRTTADSANSGWQSSVSSVRDEKWVEAITREYEEETEAEPEKPEYILASQVTRPVSGEQYGFLSNERISLNTPVYWDDTSYILNLGAGQATNTWLPGFGRAILLSAHNNSYFRCFEFIETGDIVTFETYYGTYEYEVTKVEVYNENDLSYLLWDEVMAEKEQLIMYTCFPFYEIPARRTDRLTVFCERVKGLDVLEQDPAESGDDSEEAIEPEGRIEIRGEEDA